MKMGGVKFSRAARATRTHSYAHQHQHTHGMETPPAVDTAHVQLTQPHV